MCVSVCLPCGGGGVEREALSLEPVSPGEGKNPNIPDKQPKLGMRFIILSKKGNREDTMLCSNFTEELRMTGEKFKKISCGACSSSSILWQLSQEWTG